MKRLAMLLMVIIQLTPTTVSAQAQNAGIHTNIVADSIFDAGVLSFRNGQYETARIQFLDVSALKPLHTKTTAAALMAAKSAYRLGEYRRTSTELSRFLEAYPSSSYIDEARSLLSMAGTVINRSNEVIVSIGVILSLDPQEVTQTQALFNGLLFAVQQYNRTSLERRIRIVFRNTESQSSKAAQAVDELADEGVEFIIGALFSEQAIAAAKAAEENEIVFVAPLATDERVTDGRRYAFQANPSIRMRGKLMARFAVNGLRLRTLGVLASADPERISERLTDSFIEEALRLGAEINYVMILENANQWVRLSEIITSDTLKYMDALYIPITDNPPEPAIGAVFSGLGRLRADIRILGNTSYHDIPMRTDASRYRTTYTNDFYVDTENELVSAFNKAYGLTHADSPDRLVYTGYDVTSFLLKTLDFARQDRLVDVLPDAPTYHGIATRIGFQGGNVNRTMFFHRYSEGHLQLLR